MAEFIRTDGLRARIEPNNGSDFGLDELQAYVAGQIEVVALQDSTLMVVNEEGKLLGLPFNETATQLWEAVYGPDTDIIMGDVVICSDSEIR